MVQARWWAPPGTFTAFKLAVPYTVTSDFTVTPHDDLCLRPRQRRPAAKNLTTSATVTVPRAASLGGPAFTQYTSTIPVKAGKRSLPADLVPGRDHRPGRLHGRFGQPSRLACQVGYPSDKTVERPQWRHHSDRRRHRLTSQYVFNTVGLIAGTYDIPLVITFTAAAPVTVSAKVDAGLSPKPFLRQTSARACVAIAGAVAFLFRAHRLRQLPAPLAKSAILRDVKADAQTPNHRGGGVQASVHDRTNRASRERPTITKEP